MHKPPNFLDKCFKDKDGHIVLWQNPNALLWTWLVSSVAVRVFTQGRPNRLFEALAFGALFAWAYLEARSGADYFRRGLGVLVLIGIIVGRIQ